MWRSHVLSLNAAADYLPSVAEELFFADSYVIIFAQDDDVPGVRVKNNT